MFVNLEENGDENIGKKEPQVIDIDYETCQETSPFGSYSKAAKDTLLSVEDQGIIQKIIRLDQSQSYHLGEVIRTILLCDLKDILIS